MMEWSIPQQNAEPYDVSPDLEGNIWAADVGQRTDGDSGATLRRFNPTTEEFTFQDAARPCGQGGSRGPLHPVGAAGPLDGRRSTDVHGVPSGDLPQDLGILRDSHELPQGPIVANVAAQRHEPTVSTMSP